MLIIIVAKKKKIDLLLNMKASTWTVLKQYADNKVLTKYPGLPIGLPASANKYMKRALQMPLSMHSLYAGTRSLRNHVNQGIIANEK